jgi:alanyl-tRNA synthetase
VLGLKEFSRKVCLKVFESYEDYEELKNNKQNILDEIEKEETRFNLTLEQGIKMFEKLVSENKNIDGKNAFLLYQSYGFPIEIVEELATEKKMKVDIEGLEDFTPPHQYSDSGKAIEGEAGACGASDWQSVIQTYCNTDIQKLESWNSLAVTKSRIVRSEMPDRLSILLV